LAEEGAGLSDDVTAWQRDLLALHGLLDSLPPQASADRERLRGEVVQVGAALRLLRKAAKVRFTKAKGAPHRILEYLKLFVGVSVSGDELEVVSGIHEYPRRIRELRTEHGYVISTGLTRTDLRPDEYVLEAAEPNADEAAKWQLANNIRKMPGAGKSRMLELLKASVGKPVSGEQLLYVAKIKDMRRVRELRTEDGWRISTRFTGQPNLPSGVYVLETAEQLPPHDRKIPDTVYDDVLKRDDYRCRKCSWSVSQRRPGERKQFIELHHVEHHKAGGANNKENLITLCNICHDDVHRRRVDGKGFWDWLRDKAE
jgi:hypothetical protein